MAIIDVLGESDVVRLIDETVSDRRLYEVAFLTMRGWRVDEMDKWVKDGVDIDSVLREYARDKAEKEYAHLDYAPKDRATWIARRFHEVVSNATQGLVRSLAIDFEEAQDKTR